jgi:hypothetical protein
MTLGLNIHHFAHDLVGKSHRHTGLLALLRYATLHEYSRFWIGAILTILTRKGVRDVRS